jgi:Pentapeptide repeats (8 copies)
MGMRRIGGVRLERRPDRQTWMQRWGAGLSVTVAVVLFAVFALVLGRGAAWLDGNTLHGLTASKRASEIDTMRGYLIQIGAGVLAAGALLYTALNFQLAREGHVTDRYTKAIEQLGSDRLDVRLGAIYALERIMIDSARDHPTIVEVLAAFVREHSPAAAPGPDPDSGGGQPEQHPPPATDVQAAVTVLGRRPAGRTERGPVNLTRANLIGVDLACVDLRSVKLGGADLRGADLGAADLRGVDLVGANLADADLIGARLAGAHLETANLVGARLAAASLVGAHLIAANLADADLRGADLAAADLLGVTLTDEQRSALRGLPGGGP